MYKVKNDLPSKIISSDLFCQTEMNPSNLRIQHYLEVPFLGTWHHGSESISYLGLMIWDILPASKEVNSLNSF